MPCYIINTCYTQIARLCLCLCRVVVGPSGFLYNICERDRDCGVLTCYIKLAMKNNCIRVILLNFTFPAADPGGIRGLKTPSGS